MGAPLKWAGTNGCVLGPDGPSGELGMAREPRSGDTYEIALSSSVSITAPPSPTERIVASLRNQQHPGVRRASDGSQGGLPSSVVRRLINFFMIC